MKRAQAFFAFSVSAVSLVVLAACASGGGTTTTITEPDSSAPKTNQKPPVVVPPVVVPVVDAAPPPVCVDSCVSDEDCANSCPSVSSGSQCCDLETGSCYRSAESVCPIPQVRDAGGGSMY